MTFNLKHFLFEFTKLYVMGKVRDIMEKNVITIEQDKSALDAARLISEKDISFLVIVKDGIPTGVVSERDFVRKVVANDKQASKIPLSEIMSFKFRWVEPSTTIEEAIQKMLNNNIRRLIILENNKLVGVITQTDLASFLRSKLLIDGTVKNLEKDVS